MSETSRQGARSRVDTSPTPIVRALPPFEVSNWRFRARGVFPSHPHRVATPVTRRSVLSSHPTNPNLPSKLVLLLDLTAFLSHTPSCPGFRERLREPAPSDVSHCTFFLSLLGLYFFFSGSYPSWTTSANLATTHSFKLSLGLQFVDDRELLASGSPDSFDVHPRIAS
jgi:hypothetical protein